jgi:hypothetical protein
MRKFFVASAAVLTLSLGALGIAALNPFGGAGAASPSTTTPAKPSTSANAPTAAKPGPSAGPAIAAPRAIRPGVGIVQSVLADLVSKGTITQSQSDAIMAALKAKVMGLRGSRPVATAPARPATPMAGKGFRLRVRKGGLVIAAKAIGITPKVLLGDLKAHQSIAQVATAKGVAPSKVVAALVSAGDARIDKALKAGRISSAQAAKLKARLAAAATKAVNATH